MNAALLVQDSIDYLQSLIDSASDDLAAHIAKGVEGHDTQVVVKDGNGQDIPFKDDLNRTVSPATLKIGVVVSGTPTFYLVPVFPITDQAILDSVTQPSTGTVISLTEQVDGQAAASAQGGNTAASAGSETNFITSTDVFDINASIKVMNDSLSAHIQAGYGEVHGKLQARSQDYYSSDGTRIAQDIVAIEVGGVVIYAPAKTT